jgi:hypothetical protein
MSAETTIVTLRLTYEEASTLRGLVETYLDVDGPAFECTPEWNRPHDPDVLVCLRAAVLAAVKPTLSSKKSSS